MRHGYAILGEMDEKLLTTSEAVKRAGVSRRTFVRWMNDPNFPKPVTRVLADRYKWHYWNWNELREWMIEHHKWDPRQEMSTAAKGRPAS